MKKIFKPGLCAFLLGFVTQLLVFAIGAVVRFLHLRDHHLFGVNTEGYATLAALLILPIAVAKLFKQRTWWYGLLAGVGMSLPLMFIALHGLSPSPKAWRWLLGWPMFWMYVAAISFLLLTSLWAQGAALWFARRRILAALVASTSIGLAVACCAAGLAVMRSHFARARAMQSSVTNKQIDVLLPNLALTAMDNTPIPSSDLQGRVTVIDFWGTWCGACIAEFPALEAVHKEYSGNSSVRFLLVNPEIEGDTPEKIRGFLQHKPLAIPIALDQQQSYFELSAKLKNNGLPLLIVLDRSGHIRFCENGFDTADKTEHGLQVQIDTLLAAK